MNSETHTIANKAHAAARVCLLFLTTVSFGALWDRDSQFQQEVLARREQGRESLVAAADDADPAHPAGSQMLSDDSAAPASQTQIAREIGLPPVELPSNANRLEAFPTKNSVVVRDVSHVGGWALPLGIVPGDYRVVDSRGAVDLVRISPADVIDQGSIAGREAREMYLFDDSERRVYFIRVASKDAISSRDGRATGTN